jgi:hypothetical protein
MTAKKRKMAIISGSGGEWHVHLVLESHSYFRGYVVFLRNPTP